MRTIDPLALPHAPDRSSDLVPAQRIRIDIGGAVVVSAVYDYGDHVVIPLQVRMPRGGYMRGMFELDRVTFDRALAFARARGLTAVRLADLAERVLGSPALFSIETRSLPPG